MNSKIITGENMQNQAQKQKIAYVISNLILINDRIREMQLLLGKINKRRWIDDVIDAIKELELDNNFKKQLIKELVEARDTNSTAIAELGLSSVHSAIYNYIKYLLLKLESD